MDSSWVQTYDPLGFRVALDAGGRRADRRALGALGRRGLRPGGGPGRIGVGAGGCDRGLPHAGVHGRWRPPAMGRASDCCRSAGSCLAAVFLFHLTVRTGQFEVVKHSVAAISPDRRMQALLIAFSLRHVRRRRRRLRHAGGHLGRAADRPRLLAALRRRTGADGQHVAGGLRRPGHADHHAGQGLRASTRWRCQPDGRPAIAVLLADHARVAGGHDVGLAGRARLLAGDRWSAAAASPAIQFVIVELSRPDAGRRASAASARWCR